MTSEAPQSTNATASSSVPHLDDQTFYQFLQTNGDNLCVVDYYSGVDVTENAMRHISDPGAPHTRSFCMRSPCLEARNMTFY